MPSKSRRASYLSLPIRRPRAQDAELAPFQPAEGAPHLPVEGLGDASSTHTVCKDVVTGNFDVSMGSASGLRLVGSGLEYERVGTHTYSIGEGDPLSAAITQQSTLTIGRGDRRIQVKTTSSMKADAAAFYVTATLDAYEAGAHVYTRSWTFTYPRDLV